MRAPRWVRRPEGSNWGDFGPDDMVGRLNLLTPERRRVAAREVREGIAFPLSLPLDWPAGSIGNPRRHPPRRFAAADGDSPAYNRSGSASPAFASTGVVCDDAVTLWTQYSTQWDGLAHIGALFDADGDGVDEIVYYNGWRAGSDVVGPIEDPHAPDWGRFADPDAGPMGVDHLAATGIQGRGVLIDLHASFGRERRYVSYDDLMRVIEADRIVVERGDILLLRTGLDEVILEANGAPSREALHGQCAGLDGSDEALLRWITDTGIAAIASDNRAVEQLPARRVEETGPSVPLHHHCLFKLGIPLGELWLLRDLAAWLRAAGRHRCFLTAPPLRLAGAVGSPVTPVATV